MLKRALTGLAKALVVVVGVGYGVSRALDVFSPDDEGSGPPDQTNTENPKPGGHAPAAEATIDRLGHLEERLTRLENSVEALMTSAEHASNRSSATGSAHGLNHGLNHNSTRAAEHLVTRAELDAAMEQFSSTLDMDVQRRFDIQNRSVQSLRTMVARTDELLEQVLETIESISVPV